MDKDEYIKELIQIIEKLHKENEDLKYENNLKDNEIKILKKNLVLILILEIVLKIKVLIQK